jgi:hypothetical protein
MAIVVGALLLPPAVPARPPTADAPASPNAPAAAMNAAPPAEPVLLASKMAGDDDWRRNAWADRPEDRSDDDAIDCSTRSTVFMLPSISNLSFVFSLALFGLLELESW